MNNIHNRNEQIILWALEVYKLDRNIEALKTTLRKLNIEKKMINSILKSALETIGK